MTYIGNYQITETVAQGRNYIVYRAMDKDANLVMIKNPNQNALTPENVAKLKNEFNTLNQFSSPFVIKAIDILKYDNNLAMIIEDFKGHYLKEHIIKNSPITNSDQLIKSLGIALKIAKGLADIHKKQIIHNDINPSNIIYNTITRELKIIDFELATNITEKEEGFIIEPISGTFAYMSPEKCNAKFKQVDYRSDYYAFGITLYELLTGRLPFQANNQREWIHCHIARKPLEIHRTHPEIPVFISDMILKLLEKKPENRYQSSYGIIKDIEQCIKYVSKPKQAAGFVPGKYDIYKQLNIKENIYGRDREIKLIWDLISQNKTQCIFIKGESGIGKTTIVDEVKKRIPEQSFNLASSKLDQFENTAPYPAMVKIVQSLTNKIIALDEKTRNYWVYRIKNTLHENLAFITNLAPDLEIICGKQEYDFELQPKEAHQRFDIAIQKFIGLFASAKDPLILFIDDLQWADKSTIELLKKIILSAQDQQICLLGSFRTEEISSDPKLRKTISDIEKNGITVKEIELLPLSLTDVKALLADNYSVTTVEVESLANICHNRTQGNPFFLSEYLSELHKSNLIHFDNEKGKYSWSIKQIEQQEVPGSIAGLISNKLRKIPLEIRQTIEAAACLGSTFNITTFAELANLSIEKATTIITEAQKESLIIPVEENILTNQEKIGKNYYRFIHDRVHQSTYNEIEEEKKAQLHLKAAFIIEKNNEKDITTSQLFALARHYNLGKKLLDSDSLDKAIAVNIRACRKAKESGAFMQAYKFAEAAYNLSNNWNIKTTQSQLLEINMEFAEAATLVGNHKQMNELIHEVYNTTENVLQKAKLHEIKTMSLIAQNKQQEAVKETIFLLKLLGERFPSKPGVPQMLIQLFKTRLNLKKYNLAKPDTLQPMSNPLKIAAMRNMANIISVLYRTDPNLFALLVFKLVNLTLKYGVAPISPVGFITFGLLTNVIFKKLDKGYELGKAGMKLFKRLDANKHWPQAYYIYNVGITPWKERLEKVCDNLYDAYLKAGEAGDYEYMMSAAAAGAHYRFRAGFELNELINTTKKHKQSISNVYEKISSSQFDVLLQMFTNFVVPKEKPEELIGELYNEKKMIEYHKKDNDETSLIMIYLDKLTLAYYFGRYEEALKIIESAKKYTKGVSGLLMEANYCFFETLTLLANYNNTCPLKKRKFRKRIAKNLKKMQTWALNAPMNFSCKAKLMEAEKESIIGNNLKSGTLYEEAISGSIKNQFIHETALGNELAGNHWARQKNKRVSEFYIKEAFRLYNLWGANAKLEDLKKRYKEIVNLEHDKIQAIINHESYRSSKYSISIDIETLIDASKTILKEWDYGELINNTLKVLIEHAGAQKGLLLLTKNHKDEEKLFIEARGWVKQDKILTRIDEKEMNKAILPISVVNAAYKTQETIILHNANIEGSYVHDNYIKENEVKSIIALPITKQKEAIGILYLENNLDTNVFNQSRVNLLSILCTQLAISLENLSLYKKIDQKVRQRTVEVIKQKEKVEMQASELKEINNKLEASNATKDKLFSIIGHDLRNPFNIILGQVSLLKEGIENIAQDNIKTSACFIENASKSAYQLLQNLLAWAMTQTKQVKLYTKTISLHALVNREVEMLVNMAETKNIDLKNLTKEEIEILADEETVSTVIRNLISNAIKFTEKDGQITINAKENKSEVEITVKDNGVGIKEENIAKIFGSEETLSTRGTESEKGIGIGLKICKEFVEQNNGKIWVESEYGEGSKFIFTLPLA